jgi:hypothetical protein
VKCTCTAGSMRRTMASGRQLLQPYSLLLATPREQLAECIRKKHEEMLPPDAPADLSSRHAGPHTWRQLQVSQIVLHLVVICTPYTKA